MTSTTEILFVVAPTKFVFPVGFGVLSVASALQQMLTMAVICFAAFLLASFHFLRPVILSVRSGEQCLTLISWRGVQQIRSSAITEMTYKRSPWMPVGSSQLYLTLDDGQRLPLPGASGSAYLRAKPLDLPPPSGPRRLRVCRTREALSIIQDRTLIGIDTSPAALLSPSK